MAHNPKLSDAAADAAADAVCALLNSGKLRIYDGSQAANANTAVSGQTKLVEFTLPNPAFGASSAGVATANTISAATVIATGTAAWFRAVKSDGTTVVFDGSVGTSGCDINLPSTSLTSGNSESVTAFAYTQPES
jgi:hypothetical protein